MHWRPVSEFILAKFNKKTKFLDIRLFNYYEIEMLNYKKDFPVFKKNPNLIYLDNAATTQKPGLVIDGIKNYLEKDYANIHRGHYSLSQSSEKIYHDSKQKVLTNIGATDSEVVYTYNATYAFNLLVKSLIESKVLQKGDKVLLGVGEHNSNIVPWLMARDRFGIVLDFIKLDENCDYDIGDFYKKYDKTVKLVSLNYVSNMTGVIYNLSKIKHYLRNDTIFVVDGSQAVPNFFVDFDNLGADFMIFTAHKIMAETGLGILVGKKYMFERLRPSIGGGGAIDLVSKDGFTFSGLPQSREPGTPHLTGALSLLKAFEYIESIGGYETIWKHEQEMAKYILNKFNYLSDYVEIIGPKDIQNKVALFSFVVKKAFSGTVGNLLAQNNICIRTGGHCAHILLQELAIKGGTSRLSAYLYNDFADIDKFFKELEKIAL